MIYDLNRARHCSAKKTFVGMLICLIYSRQLVVEKNKTKECNT